MPQCQLASIASCGQDQSLEPIYLTGRSQESRWLNTRPTNAATKKIDPTRMAIPLVERTELPNMLAKTIQYLVSVCEGCKELGCRSARSVATARDVVFCRAEAEKRLGKSGVWGVRRTTRSAV